MTDEASPPHILRALEGIMGEVTAMGKDGFNSQQKFPFRSHDGVVNLLGPAYRKHKVIAEVVVTSEERRQYQTKTGTNMMETRVKINYSLVSLVDNSKHLLAKGIPGEAADAGDKSSSKAVTVAVRQALLHGFTIPTQDADPDETIVEQGPTVTVEMLTAEQATLMSKITDKLVESRKKALNAWYKGQQLPKKNDLSREQADMVLTEMSRLLTEQTRERESIDPETGEIIEPTDGSEPF